MKITIWTLTSTLLVLTAYLSLWPVSIEPVSWQAPVTPGHAGAHAPNNRLTDIQLIDLDTEVGAEHVVPRHGIH